MANDPMHGIEEPVPFDNATADALMTACRTAATLIDGQQPSRNGWVTHAKTDFSGYYADLFGNNAISQSNDAQAVAARLRDVANGVQALKEAAAREQKRRDDAKAWKKKVDSRSTINKVTDAIGLTHDDQCPIPAPEPQLNPAVSTLTPTPRQPLEGNGGSGTSSARPANLRSFANDSKGANDTLRPKPGTIQTAYDSFKQKCTWGSIDASGVIAGFGKYIEANDNDVTWANTVAGAFEKAGGEGVVTTSNAAIQASLKAAGVNAERTDLTIPPPATIGHPPTTGYSNDPVNVATGNFIENEIDLAFTDGCGNLSFERTYNSIDDAVGAFGVGWASWADVRLILDEDVARWVLPDGRQIYFPRQGEGWDRAERESYWLQRSGERLVVTDNAGGTWTFTQSGQQLGLSRGEGTGIALQWAEGRLVGMTHERGRSITVEWGSDRVAALQSSDGRRVEYGYDQGRLVSATTGGATRTYRWNEAGLVDAVIDADGVVEAENTYDERNRVITQRSQFGRVTRFQYLGGGVTVVADDGTGERANTWICDEFGRQVGIVDAHGERQSTSYDRWSNPVVNTERDGATTLSEYDERGRKVKQLLPTGAKISWSYDEQDRVVEGVVAIDADTTAVTRFGYDGASRNPSLIVDPLGGETRLRWERGLLAQVTDPTGVTLRYDYDAHGDLIAMTDAEGHVARLRRDALGRVITATTPSGRATVFSYNEAGLLAARVDPDGGKWRFEYTAGGRRTAYVDPIGARAEFAFDESGNQTLWTDPRGYQVHKVYDDLGNLATLTLPDGTAWEYRHDALSRLVSSTDPMGGVWEHEYDVTGELTASVDPTGVRTEITRSNKRTEVRVFDGLASTSSRADRLGRIVAATGEDGVARLTRYDLSGRPIEYVDADGNVTRMTRDAGGRIVELRRPSGVVTHYAYNACGYLAAVTDGLGQTTRFEYTEDGLVAREVKPNGDAHWWAYDVCGRVAAEHTPGVGTIRYERDLRGRVVRERSTQFGLRTFRYDISGNLIEATAGNGGVTRYEYDSMGALAKETDPLGNVTTYERDALGRVVTLTDPLGRVTRGEFDSAGRQLWQEGADGRRVEWQYDKSGRFCAMRVGGELSHTVERDFIGRTMVVTEGDTRHVVRWNGHDELVERTRDGQTLRWEYDADGNRAAMITPDGARTDYLRDSIGRVTAIRSSRHGEVQLGWDAGGNVVAASAGGVRQTWTYEDGFVAGHDVAQDGRYSRTFLERDEDGRVVRMDRDGAQTTYTYDGASQLVETTTDGLTSAYTYDPSGRMVRETVGRNTRELAYDAAGQLLEIVGKTRTTFAYDEAGRRVSERSDDGTSREFAWDAKGWLSSVTISDGVTTRSRSLHVDALSELARVDDSDVFWDTAQPYAPSLVQAGGESIVKTLGFTGTDQGWQAPGWRTERGGGEDPWGVQQTATLGGLGLGSAGEMMIADGLEWLGHRLLDHDAKAFLSVDPLDSVTGAGWAANPYSYAGNDPIQALDPTGLRPVTDAELKAYNDAHQGALQVAGNWLKNNWEYVAGGAMVIAGGVLMATGVGGPAGIMLVSAGADTIIQKATTGKVNWGEVAFTAVTAPIGGGEAVALKTAGKEAVEIAGKDALEQGVERTAAKELANVGEGGAERTATKAVECGSENGCFVAGTEVLLADGSSKAIEDVQVGDEVQAFNADTGAVETHTVEETFVHENVLTYEVEIEGGEIVTTTSEHPFFVDGKGWTPAKHLGAGDQLLSPDGGTSAVASVTATGDRATVYNFTVEGVHSYFVAFGRTWIAAHNVNCRELANQIRESGVHPAARNQRTIAVGEDAEGNLFAGSSNGFDAGQRQALKDLGIERVPGSGSLHAEEELMRAVDNLKRVGTSKRMPCGPAEHDCAGQLSGLGVKVDLP